jgi:hypothetical protein
MRGKNFLFIICFLFITNMGLRAQISLYNENFNGGTHTWTLNTTDVSSSVGPNVSNNIFNYWIVNNLYQGGGGILPCSFMGIPLDLPYTFNNTTTQPAQITGNPNSNYMHITAVGSPMNAGYMGVDGLCVNATNHFTRMSNDVSTVGYDDVSFDFWWIGTGADNSYMQLFYSTNSGTSWTQVNMGTPGFFTQNPIWKKESVSIPAFGNQANLRFGFRLMNGAGNTVIYDGTIGFGLDDIEILALEPATPVEINTGVVSPLSFCPGETFQLPFTIVGDFNAGNTFTAQLSDPTGGFASPVSVGTLAGANAGTITVTIPPGTAPGTAYRVRVVSSSPGATGTVNANNITILSAPLAGNITSSNSSVCPNGTTSINITGNSGNIQWQQSSNGTTFTDIAGQTGTNLTTSPLTETTHFRAVITNQCGSVETNAVVITIENNIVIDINMNPASGSLCTGTVALSVTGSFSTFTWSNGATGNSTTVTEPGQYCGNGIDVSGCPVVANCVNVVEADPQPISITPGGNVIICNGTLTLTATPGFVSYQWTGGGTNSSIIVSEEGAYTVTGIDANGCESVSEPVNATVGNTAVLNVSPPDPAICSGQPITLTADPGFSNYLWSTGQTGPTITVTTGGLFTVTAVDPGGCNGVSPTITVASGQDPISNFNYFQPNQLTATFNNTSQNANNYFWDFDGLGTSELQSPSFTFPSPGIYYVSLSTNNSCGEDDIVKIVSISSVGIAKLDGIDHIALFPNPVQDVLNIAFEFANQGRLTVDIFNMSGKQITSRSFNGNGFIQETFDFSNLSAGLYVIRFISGNSVSYAKVIKR